MLTAAQSHCDAAVAEFAQAADKNKHETWVLVATILASSLAFVDSSVVDVALPAIARSFSAEASDLQWIINAYLLPLSSLLLLGGAAGDRFGRLKVLTLGTVLFVVASIACAVAPSLFWLFAARGLQGCGAALLMPNSLAILGADIQSALTKSFNFPARSFTAVSNLREADVRFAESLCEKAR